MYLVIHYGKFEHRGLCGYIRSHILAFSVTFPGFQEMWLWQHCHHLFFLITYNLYLENFNYKDQKYKNYVSLITDSISDPDKEKSITKMKLIEISELTIFRLNFQFVLRNFKMMIFNHR